MASALPPENPAVGEPPAKTAPPYVRAAVVLKHAALALALAGSAALYIDYGNVGDPAFCGVASGCFAVRISPYSNIGGIPLPHLALPAFAVLLLGSILARSAEQHRLVAGAAGLGGLAAIALLIIQAFVLGTFCPWCVAVDTATIVAGAAAIVLSAWVGDDAERAHLASLRPPAAIAWGVAAAIAAGLPFVWARYPVVPPAPPPIAAEAVPGKVTIVSFTDFECPFCRKLHPLLDKLREEHPDEVHLVRKMKPLAGHPGALPAAKAYLCAPEARRDAVADALYRAEPHELTEPKVAALADRLDLGGREAFAACLTAPSTAEALERDSDAFTALGGRGLPFTWVNGRVILGADAERLHRTVAEELSGPRPALPIAALFAVLGVVFSIASVLSWRAPFAPAGDVGSSRG